MKVIATNPQGEQIIGSCALAAVTLGEWYGHLVREGTIQVAYDDDPRPWTYELVAK